MESRYALQTLAHTQATEAEQKKKILRGVFQQNLLLVCPDEMLSWSIE
jgi:hypothetical protein